MAWYEPVEPGAHTNREEVQISESVATSEGVLMLAYRMRQTDRPVVEAYLPTAPVVRRASH
jgi:hypothetical protein